MTQKLKNRLYDLYKAVNPNFTAPIKDFDFEVGPFTFVKRGRRTILKYKTASVECLSDKSKFYLIDSFLNFRNNLITEEKMVDRYFFLIKNK